MALPVATSTSKDMHISNASHTTNLRVILRITLDYAATKHMLLFFKSARKSVGTCNVNAIPAAQRLRTPPKAGLRSARTHEDGS